jgi:hypothetical protein
VTEKLDDVLVKMAEAMAEAEKYGVLKEFGEHLARALMEFNGEHFTAKQCAKRVAELLDPEHPMMPLHEWNDWKNLVKSHLNTLSTMGVLEKRRIHMWNEYRVSLTTLH